MRRFVKSILLLLVVVFGIWALSNQQRIKSPGDLINIARENISSFKIPVFQSSTRLMRRTPPAIQRGPDTIRIATFKLNSDTAAAQEAEANLLMTEICRQFDLISFQGVSSRHPDWLANLLRSLESSTGDTYKFVTSRFVNGIQFVTLFNSTVLELENSNYYSVNDPDELFLFDPFVCWFRALRTDKDKAFTFSLVSIHVDSSKSSQELMQLGNLYRTVRDDGRGEDDIIVVGDFHIDATNLVDVLEPSGLQSVLSVLPTNMLRTAQFDNILSSPIATVEHAGSAGVFDFMKHYNLYLKDALKISDHLPVWADYSIYEGVVPGRVAEIDTEQSTR